MWIILLLIIPGIAYLVIRAAVQEGVYNGLKDYDQYKKEEGNKD